MSKLIVSEFLTLDGVMQAPGDPDEDRRGDFRHGGWQSPFFDELLGKFVSEGLADAGGLLLGRRTYEIFAAHWPNQPADDPLAGTLNALPKHVASTTLTDPLDWQNSTVISGDVAAGIGELKVREGKDLLVIGSGELVQTLVQHELVDEYRLMVHPIVLGAGRRLFPDDSRKLPLQLIGWTTSTTGVLILTYRPARNGE